MTRPFTSVFYVMIAALTVMVGACAQQPYDYRNIKPRWQISNSPIPVPQPKAKPWVRYVEAAPVTRVQWSPAASRQSAKAPSSYAVRKGDTVYSLARRHNIPARQIIKANGLRKPYHLRVGQRLVLKGSAPTVRAAKAVAKTTVRAAPKRYKVKRGDSVYAIARANGVPANELIKANRLKKPYTLRIGQTLTIPNSASRPVMASTPRSLSPNAGRAAFIWPASGKVISRYGVKADGLRNDGINISAPAGSAVYSSAAGEVIYAGNRLRAFGTLILVRHRNGMVSAYAHVDKLLVQTGQHVVQGEQIATVGTSGLVSTPQLHFELRRNSEAIDPMRYLGRTQMAAAGR